MTSFSKSASKSRYVVSKMESSNLDEVMEIERSAYEFPWTKSMFSTSLSSSDSCNLLYVENTLVGYAIVSYILDEAHLLNICISPKYEGLGYGRVLLREVIVKAREKKSIWFFLEVRSSNSRAINLYFSEGFNEVGVRPNYYPSKVGKEDAVLMTLDLSVDVIV